MDRVGQVSGVAGLDLRFLLLALVVLGGCLVAGRRGGPAWPLVRRCACAATAGLTTGLIAGGILLALRGTDWPLFANDGDSGQLLRWADDLLAGRPPPADYPAGDHPSDRLGVGPDRRVHRAHPARSAGGGHRPVRPGRVPGLAAAAVPGLGPGRHADRGAPAARAVQALHHRGAGRAGAGADRPAECAAAGRGLEPVADRGDRPGHRGGLGVAVRRLLRMVPVVRSGRAGRRAGPVPVAGRAGPRAGPARRGRGRPGPGRGRAPGRAAGGGRHHPGPLLLLRHLRRPGVHRDVAQRPAR